VYRSRLCLLGLVPMLDCFVFFIVVICVQYRIPRFLQPLDAVIGFL